MMSLIFFLMRRERFGDIRAKRNLLVELAGDDRVDAERVDRSVKLRGDYCVLDEELEGNDFEGVLVSGFEDDGAGRAGLLDLKPPCSTDAPAVARFEAGESVLGHWGAEVVAEGFGGLEEGRVDDAADGVDAVVVGAGLAAAGAVEAGHWLAAAEVEGLAEDVFAAVFDGFYGGHENSSIPLFWERMCPAGRASCAKARPAGLYFAAIANCCWYS